MFQARDAGGAEAALRQVLAIDPGHAPSLRLLGLIAGRAGRDGECIALLEAASAAHADPAEAAASLVLLGVAQGRAGRSQEAEAAYRRALAMQPGSTEATLRLGQLLEGLGRPAEAVDVLRAAVAAEPDLAAVHAALGTALLASGRADEAVAAFERALALAPGAVQPLYNLALARKEQGRADEAVGLLREVRAVAPDLAAARFALCMAHLPTLYDDEAEIGRRRAAYAAELDALVDHAERVGAGTLAPGVGAAQPFQLAYQGRNDVGLQRRYGILVCKAMAEAFAPAPLAAPPKPGERIRVGVVCGMIRDHSVWRIPTRGWVEGLDRARFELIGYHTGALRDAETDRAERLFDRFVQGPLPVTTWRDRIVTDRPHVLIYPEIGMDPMAAQLAALRLAPVQYTSWGHPSTSGYTTIDAFLSSDDMEPETGQDQYSERLVRLPGLSTPMRLPRLERATPGRAEFGLPAGATVYWCGQSLYKYLPRHDPLFAEIARRTPGCRLVFIEYPGSPAITEQFRGRLDRAFEHAGLDARTTCVILPRMDGPGALAAMACADVVLDSLDWSGCNSLLDALVHRLPVVTCPGASMRSRHGSAILGRLGLHDMVCPTEDVFVKTAVALGADSPARASIRQRIEAGLPALASETAVNGLVRVIESDLASGPGLGG